MLVSIIGLVILTLIDIIGILGGELTGLYWVLLGTVVIGWAGLAMVGSGQREKGTWLLLVPAIAHIPIGLVVAYGVKQFRSEDAKARFEMHA